MFEKWADENLRRFNKAKCKVCHLYQGNLRYRLGEELCVSNSEEKYLGSWQIKGTSQRCVFTTWWSTVSWAVSKHEWEEGGDCPPIFCLWVSIWNTAWGRWGLLDLVRRRIGKIIRVLEHYEERLREQGLYSLGNRRPWRDLFAVFQYWNRAYSLGGDRLHTWSDSDRMGGMVLNWKSGNLRRKLSLIREWGTDTGCLEKLWIFYHWACSGSGWIWPWAVWSNALYRGWQPCRSCCK